MKKIIATLMILVLTISMLPLSPNKVKAAEIETEKMDIPQEVLNSLPEEIQSMLSGEKITKEQYELYLELIEKEKNEGDNSSSVEITPFASNVNPANCQYDLGSNYCFRIDSQNSSTGEPYHIHIYKKKVHIYCMRLDNFKECDKNKNDVHKFDDLPNVVKEGVMAHKKVQERVKVYNPDAQKWSDSIPFIKSLAISVIVVALVVTPIPGDEYVAWAYFLRAIA